MLKEGEKAPNFNGVDTNGEKRKLSDYKGKILVLYFYPKDLTPGCTIEACDFSANVASFKKKNTEILGVSLDSVESHQKFTEKKKLKFPLLADVDKKISTAYGVYGQKSFMGKKYMGIERTTFVIDCTAGKNKIKRIFPKVKVFGHWKDVLEAV